MYRYSDAVVDASDRVFAHVSLHHLYEFISFWVRVQARHNVFNHLIKILNILPWNIQLLIKTNRAKYGNVDTYVVRVYTWRKLSKV